MSLRVTGYHPDGSRIVVDDGPARARCVGNGGLPLSQALTSVTQPPRKRRIPRAPLNRTPPRLKTRPLCGFLMPIAKEHCNRTPGHSDSHRSARIMADDYQRRQSRRCRPRP